MRCLDVTQFYCIIESLGYRDERGKIDDDSCTKI